MIFVSQCTELSKTSLHPSCLSISTIIHSSAVPLAAQSHSGRPSCCITTWNTIMVRSRLWRESAAPPGVSRPGPRTNRLLLLVWMAQREGAPSLPLCVSVLFDVLPLLLTQICLDNSMIYQYIVGSVLKSDMFFNINFNQFSSFRK